MELTAHAASGIALCLNAGSTSLKAALVRSDGHTVARHDTQLGSGDALPEAVDGAVDALVARGTPDVVGHRVVHGGDRDAPTLVDARVLGELRGLVSFAPLHEPGALLGIERVGARLPDVPNVACFDTTFHRELPEVARRLPLPEWCWEQGIRRYGFHGLSYEFVVDHLGDELGPRSVIAHLGGGSSVVALRDRRAVDTTMSLTPGGGLVMATRSGDLDPGVVLYLLRAGGLDADATERLLERECGILGLSARTADFAELVRLTERDVERAALAFDAYTTSVSKHVAGLVTVLGGIDTLVFTGGIGRGSSEARAAVGARLAHLGVHLDPDANRAHAAVITPPSASVTVHTVETDEEAVIARHALALVAR